MKLHKVVGMHSAEYRGRPIERPFDDAGKLLMVEKVAIWIVCAVAAWLAVAALAWLAPLAL